MPDDWNPANDAIVSDDTAVLPDTSGLVLYGTSDDQLLALRDKYAELVPDSKEGYDATRRALRELVTTRTRIEARRKDLKRDALDWSRKVDAEARRLTLIIQSIEEPLQSRKDAVDFEKQRAKREAEEAEQRAIDAAERAQREAEEARLLAIRQAEDERLRVERDRLAAIEAEQRAERDRMDAERAEMDRQRAQLLADQQRAAQAERDRLAKIQAEIDAREQAERDRIEAARINAERAAAEQRELDRLASLAPDREKLASFAAQIRALHPPTVGEQAGAVLIRAGTMLVRIAEGLEMWQG